LRGRQPLASANGRLAQLEELEEKVKTLEAKVKSLETLEAKVQTLEDIEAIQKLQKAYGYYLGHMMVEDIVDLFADGEESAPMATSKYPTCGRVKIPHPWRQLEITY